jgi:hypothetical protein
MRDRLRVLRHPDFRSTSSGTRRWPSRSRPGPVADATSTETVLVGGGLPTATALALGLLPRETRMLRRAEHARSG